MVRRTAVRARHAARIEK
jgi:hypothetical protein